MTVAGFHAFEDLPLLTADLPGTGGEIKRCPADFIVEEIPEEEPAGEGPYCYLWVEKIGVSADDLLDRVAHALLVHRRDVGCAGLKDARAITRQWLSVPARVVDRIGAIDSKDISVQRVARHHSPLRAGQLLGNRFTVVLRGVGPEAEQRARATIARLQEQGLPNYYGPQRFGRDGETMRAGFALLHGEANPFPAARGGRRRFLLRLALNAAQAALFNHYLAARVADGLLHSVLAGDVLQRTKASSEYLARDPDFEQERYQARQVVPAGPLFGCHMRPAAGVVAEREAEALASGGLTEQHFVPFRKIAPGARRPLLVWLASIDLVAGDDTLELRFTLPSGTYATVLLREVVQGGG